MGFAPLKLIRQLHETNGTHSSVNMLANFFFYFLFCLVLIWTSVADIYLKDSKMFLEISTYSEVCEVLEQQLYPFISSGFQKIKM